MSISQEKLDAFQARMSNWVASQGLLFQLRHAGGVRGAQSSAVVWIVQMGVRLGIVAVLAALVFWVYLVKRIDFSGFRTKLNDGIVMGLGADAGSLGNINRERGFIEIAKLDLSGGEQSFFDTARVRGIRTKMGLLDGVLAPWNGEQVQISELVIDIRAGTEDDAVGSAIYKRLFRRSDRFSFSQVEVKDATIRWGYSGLTRGSIENAEIDAARKDGGWNLVVTGGRFSQNWLQGLEIVSMEIALLPDGVHMRGAELKSGEGRMTFDARLKGPASGPTLSGTGRMSNLSVTQFLVPEVQEYVGGEISGDFELGGSPYAAGGVTLKMNVALEEGDRIELRDRLPLFRSISVVDRYRSYKNVRFTTGRFTMETGGDRLALKNIVLHAKDVMRLEGDLLARRPTEEEVDESLRVEERGTTIGGVPSSREDDEEVDAGDEGPSETDLTLRRAAQAAFEKEAEKRAQMEGRSFGTANFSRYEDEARARQERAPVLEGSLRLGLNAKSFSRSAELDERYPVDTATGLRWLEVPLGANIYKVGVKLAEEIITRNKAE